ncbi:MAG: hypothetical protein WA982_12910 [Rubrobacteraceae bacterium]
MKKLMLLAAMLAMVLVATAPALAQTTAVQYDDNSDNSVNTAICTNVIEEIDASQVQYGDANAASVEGDAAADIAQELGITITQVNNCFNTYLLTGAPGPTGPQPVEPGGGPGNNGSSGNEKSPGGVSVLPDTGGASLFTLGTGALLVGGGLLARRIFG